MVRNEGEVIIELGAEGGSLALYGFRTERGWSFTMEVIDRTPEFTAEDPIQKKSGVVDSWDAALELLDQYPWAKLSPISIHHDFEQHIWAAVQERLRATEPELIHWRQLLRAVDTNIRLSGIQYFFSGTGVPLSKPEDVIPYLGKKTHWKEGRSAFEAAHSWFEAQDIPKSIRSVLDADPTLQNAMLEKAFFEKQTELDRYRGPSQTDILAIVRVPSGVAVLGIEAKVDESFGVLVKDWADDSESKKQRLAGLVKRLGLDGNAVGQLRYQLLHRTVATLIEAERHGAREAAMVVQSFCPGHAGFSDFQLFATAVGAPVAQCGGISTPIIRGDVRLRLGWAVDHVRVSARL
jgi:hypothetical protein